MGQRYVRRWKKDAVALYKNLKIKQKLLLYSLALLAVLCSIFALFYGKLAEDTILARADETTANNMESIALFFEDATHDIKSRLSHLDSSISVRNALLVAADGGDFTQWPVSALLDDIVNSSYIDSLSLYAPDGTLVAGVGNEEFESLSADSVPFSTVLNEGISLFWYDESAFTNSRADGVFIYQTVTGANGATIGVARLGISNATLAEMYSYIGFNISSQIYVFTNRGNLLLPVDADPIYLSVGRTNFIQFMAGENESIEMASYQDALYRVYNQPFPNYGIYVVSILPHAQLMEDVYSQQMLIGGLAVICIVLQICTLLSMAHSLSTPLNELAQHMEIVGEGNLFLRMNNPNLDEIGVLSRSYDNMLDQIEGLLEEVYQAEEQRHKLELLALQTQITPHFLYNSLENLSALAQMGDTEGAFQMAKSLGLFYRGVLSDGHNVVRMDEEVAIIENYLRVQTQRYPDRFDYGIHLDPGLVGMSIVKLTLQPLVENAINHGLRNVRRRGELTISIAELGKLLVISVKDNGKGMEKIPDLKAPNAQLEGLALRRGGYGMANVDQRLKLYYGAGYGLEITSEPNVGTEIFIRIPKIPYQEEGYDIRFNRG